MDNETGVVAMETGESEAAAVEAGAVESEERPAVAAKSALAPSVLAEVEAAIQDAVNAGLCPHPECGWWSNAASQRDRRKSAFKHMRTATVHEGHFAKLNADSRSCPICWLAVEEGDFERDMMDRLYPWLVSRPIPPQDVDWLVADVKERIQAAGSAESGSDESGDDGTEETTEAVVCPHDDCGWRPKSARAASAKIMRHAESLALHRQHLNQHYETCGACKSLVAAGKWDAPSMAKPDELREPSPDEWDLARERLRDYRLHQLSKRRRAVYEVGDLPSDAIHTNAKRRALLAGAKPLDNSGSQTAPTPLMATRALSPTFEFTGYHDNRATEATVVQEMGLLRRDLVRSVADTTRAKVTAMRSLGASVERLGGEVIALKASLDWAVLKPPPRPPTPPPEPLRIPAAVASAPLPVNIPDINKLPPAEANSLFWKTFTNQLLYGIAAEIPDILPRDNPHSSTATSSLPSDTEVVLARMVTKSAKPALERKAGMALRITTLHALYSMLSDRTTVDRELEAAKREGRVRVFSLPSEPVTVFVMAMDDYLDQIRRVLVRTSASAAAPTATPTASAAASSLLALFRAFVCNVALVLPAKALTPAALFAALARPLPEPLPSAWQRIATAAGGLDALLDGNAVQSIAARAADADQAPVLLQELVKAGLVVPSGVHQVWMAMPYGASFIVAYTKSVSQVLRVIKSTKYKELELRRLLATPTSCSARGPWSGSR
ncbi:uncharacterized protein AMSG_08733 [Thecamonas trahens ATCC 50062]|uniref:Uncharacterized protein n=1 Tax=Thecamonas trahens ATCC 50062 TaxID=461836 RepID=A0A0L0DMJ5_THETB|nr:hypothetical protein AMSG_08733 [Thecamonas trahens ATCC 50062]KNC53246.1 hypothetical protein AMSG_08733 [Thecamonas trahens ATCC 50062]|eukprot:XP_013754510.1 hypothetical protein AMSG_08733 [Thecamonas trahens ATCC 50062]